MKDEIKKNLVRRSRYLEKYETSKTAQLLIKLFINPLLSIPELANKNKIEVLRFILGADHRHILIATAEEDFKLPGNIIEGTVILIPLESQRTVKKNDRMLVRIDDRTPNRIDIELLKQPDVVFILTKRQYSTIVNKLKGSKRCTTSLKSPFLD